MRRPSRKEPCFYMQICACKNAAAARRDAVDGNSREPTSRTSRTAKAVDSVADVVGGPVQGNERMEAA